MLGFPNSNDLPALGRVTRFRQTMSQFMKCRWCKSKLKNDVRRATTFVICPKCDTPDVNETLTAEAAK